MRKFRPELIVVASGFDGPASPIRSAAMMVTATATAHDPDC